MGKVLLSFSMSLDGYVAGPDLSTERPMGRRGERLHDWMFRDGPNRATDDELVEESFARTGAVVLGRRTFDLGLPYWDEDTPFPVPSFVVTHESRKPLPTKSASFTFVDGIVSAVRQARAAAADKDVTVMGAETAQQVLAAGLADELSITLVPVLLGGGTRLFGNIDSEMVELERTRTINSPVVTHLLFTVHPATPGGAQ